MVAAPVSIVINNYNYEQYLAAAIEGALAQTYANVEVVVVDDGSTDASRYILSRYADRVTPLLKDNGGQTSALNAGMTTAQGDWVLFLDADDVVYPTTIERAMSLAAGRADVAKVHWTLEEIDDCGRRTGRLWPVHPLPSGELRSELIERGPEALPFPPTSGNLWARGFLETALPLPEIERTLADGSFSADALLSAMSPLYGRVEALNAPGGGYRLHPGNDFASRPLGQRVKRMEQFWRYALPLVQRYARRLDIHVDIDAWVRQAWWSQLSAAVDEITTVAHGRPILLVDDGWGVHNTHRFSATSFPPHEGSFWPCADDDEALSHLVSGKASGARLIVFLWPSFWWLTHYQRLAERLERAGRVLTTDRVVAFRLPDAEQ